MHFSGDVKNNKVTNTNIPVPMVRRLIQGSVCVTLMKIFFSKIKKINKSLPKCSLSFIIWCLKRVYSVVLSFASSMHQWGWWEKAAASHQGASEAVWGRHLFRGNQRIQKLDCSSAGGRRFAGVNFLTSTPAATLFSKPPKKNINKVLSESDRKQRH